MTFDRLNMGPLAVTLNRVFPASPKKIYEVWTNSTHLSKWFGCKVESDPKVGGKITIYFPEEIEGTKGEYIELSPHSRIAFTWSTTVPCENSTKIVKDTLVSIELVPEGLGTRMCLRHEGFFDVDSQMTHMEGWSQYLDMWAINADESLADSVRIGVCDTFSKSKSELFSFFTNPVEMSRAFGCPVSGDAKFKVGSALKISFSNDRIAEAIVSEFVPNEFVRFEWSEINGEGKPVEKTDVRVRVSDWPNGKGFLSLVQNGFSAPAVKKAYSQKWVEAFESWKK